MNAPDRSRSASRPPPPASIIVIGCRLLGAIALIAALAVGQWAHVVRPLPTTSTGDAESRAIFGLTEFSIGISRGSVLTTIASGSYAAADALAAIAPDAIDSAGTSKTLGMAIAALAVVSILLAIGSFGDLFDKPRLASFATFALFGAIATALLGWVFMGAGLVSFTALHQGQGVGKAAGGFSLYVSILAVLLLAIAWTRTRVLAMDAARRRAHPPPPKRRQSRTGPS